VVYGFLFLTVGRIAESIPNRVYSHVVLFECLPSIRILRRTPSHHGYHPQRCSSSVCDFHRQRDDRAIHFRQLFEMGQVFKHRYVFLEQRNVALKPLRLSVIDTGSVDLHRFDRTVFDQPAGRTRVETGKVQFVDCVSTGLMRAQVTLAVVPEASITGPQKHDYINQLSPMDFLSISQITDVDLIISILRARMDYINDGGFSDQPFQRDLVNGMAILVEVNGSVKVSPAVLGG